MDKDTKHQKGLTLVELLVVIALLGLIASVVLVSVKDSKKQAKIANLLQFDAQLYHQLGIEILGEWKFDEPGPDTCVPGSSGLLLDFCDTSGKENHGTNSSSGGVTWVRNTASTELKRAGNFSNNYVRVQGFKGIGGKNSFAASAWVSLDSNPVANQILFMQDFGALDFAVLIRTTSIYFLVPGVGQFVCDLDSNFFQSGEWHFIAVNYSGSNATIYLDAKELCPPQAASGTIASTEGPNLYIGGLGFTGLIDQARVYGQGLSPDQIGRIYIKDAIELAGARK